MLHLLTEINNTQVDDAQDIDLVMPMYNLIEYSDIFSKTSASLINLGSFINHNDFNIGFPADDNNSISFKFKEKVTGQTGDNGTKDVETMVPLKYLSNLWKTPEMPLINCEISLILTWSKNCFLLAGMLAN